MKLRIKKLVVEKSINIEETKPERKKGGGRKLPPDEYFPMVEPVKFLVRETENKKGGKIKQYLEIKIQRYDDDEALPFIWISMYQESDIYTGYLKGKSIYLPLKNLVDLYDGLYDIEKKADFLKLFD